MGPISNNERNCSRTKTKLFKIFYLYWNVGINLNKYNLGDNLIKLKLNFGNQQERFYRRLQMLKYLKYFIAIKVLVNDTGIF